jgi:hypothetical protein
MDSLPDLVSRKIVTYLDSKRQFFELSLVSRNWAAVCKSVTAWAVNVLGDDLTLVDKIPQAYRSGSLSLPGDYESMKIGFILRHRGLDWNWSRISKRANITAEDVCGNLDLPWKFDKLAINPNVKFTQESILLLPEDARERMCRTNLHVKEIILSRLTLEDLRNDRSGLLYDWSRLTAITPSVKVILENPELPWNWDAASLREDLDLRSIKDYRERPWNWSNLTINRALKVTEILEESDLPWNLSYISYRRDIKAELVKKNNDIDWDWRVLTNNEAIKVSDILNDPDLPWCWEDVMIRKDFEKDFRSLDIVIKNLKWGIPIHVTRNKILNYRDVRTYPGLKEMIWPHLIPGMDHVPFEVFLAACREIGRGKLKPESVIKHAGKFSIKDAKDVNDPKEYKILARYSKEKFLTRYQTYERYKK